MGKILIDFNEFVKVCRARFSNGCLVGSNASCSEMSCKIFKDYYYKKAECSCAEISDGIEIEASVIINVDCELHGPLLNAYRYKRDGTMVGNGLSIFTNTPRFKIVQDHNAKDGKFDWVVMIYGTERCSYIGIYGETTYKESDARRFEMKDEAAKSIFDLAGNLRKYAILVKAFNEYPMLPFNDGY